jgi:hypothetical protein
VRASPAGVEKYLCAVEMSIVLGVGGIRLVNGFGFTTSIRRFRKLGETRGSPHVEIPTSGNVGQKWGTQNRTVLATGQWVLGFDNWQLFSKELMRCSN